MAALYAGNDLYDTFDLIYGHGQLSHLRTPHDDRQEQIAALEAAQPLTERARLVTRMGKRPWPLRDFLRDHSALFHFARHLDNGSAALAGRQSDPWQATQQRALQHAEFLYAHDGGDGSRTTLTVAKRLLSLDTADLRIDESRVLVLRALREMARRSAAMGARLLIVWIPTKELVFAPWITGQTVPDLQRLIEVETDLQEQVRRTAVDLEVPFVDALPALRHSLIQGERPYPESADGHPTDIGYAHIARIVADRL